MGEVEAATVKALEQAEHLTDQDQGAVAAMLALARKIDAWSVIVDYALDDLAGQPPGKVRPAVPQNDNVSLSAYLKFCDQLGLTPAGRTKLVGKKPEAKGGKLALLQGQARSARPAG